MFRKDLQQKLRWYAHALVLCTKKGDYNNNVVGSVHNREIGLSLKVVFTILFGHLADFELPVVSKWLHLNQKINLPYTKGY